MATRQAIANLYYRSVRVLAAGRARRDVVDHHDGARPQGLVAEGRPVPRQGVARHHDQWRRYGRSSNTSAARWCGHVAASNPATTTTSPARPTRRRSLISPVDVPGWDLSIRPASEWETGDETRSTHCATTSTSPPPLARLTFNQAAVHRDATANCQRRTARLRRARARPRPGVADPDAPRPRRGPGVGRLRPRRPRVRRRPARVRATGWSRSRPPGTGRLMRFETTGTKLQWRWPSAPTSCAGRRSSGRVELAEIADTSAPAARRRDSGEKTRRIGGRRTSASRSLVTSRPVRPRSRMRRASRARSATPTTPTRRSVGGTGSRSATSRLRARAVRRLPTTHAGRARRRYRRRVGERRPITGTGTTSRVPTPRATRRSPPRRSRSSIDAACAVRIE